MCSLCSFAAKAISIYLKVQDVELLERITTSRIGEKIRLEVDGKTSNEPVVASSIKSGVVRIPIIDESDNIFESEKEAAENLHEFD